MQDLTLSIGLKPHIPLLYFLLFFSSCFLCTVLQFHNQIRELQPATISQTNPVRIFFKNIFTLSKRESCEIYTCNKVSTQYHVLQVLKSFCKRKKINIFSHFYYKIYIYIFSQCNIYVKIKFVREESFTCLGDLKNQKTNPDQ